MIHILTDIAALETLYDQPAANALKKVFSEITPLYQQWIEASRFLVLATVGPEGVDASPRGDDGAVVVIGDSKTILLPDWRGNNRLDSLRNIVRDGRISLMFMVPGCNNVVRVNGTAVLSVDPALCERFDKAGKGPTCVIQISVKEIYFQCAKALMRSNLWTSEDESAKVPTAGQFLGELDQQLNVKSYDENYPDYAKDKMW